MGEILQDSEEFILQWWDVDDNKRGFWTCIDYEEAVRKMKQYKQNDKTWGDNFKYRIVKETTKQEVVYDEFENQG
jgi:hypothetical protein